MCFRLMSTGIVFSLLKQFGRKDFTNAEESFKCAVLKLVPLCIRSARRIRSHSRKNKTKHEADYVDCTKLFRRINEEFCLFFSVHTTKWAISSTPVPFTFLCSRFNNVSVSVEQGGVGQGIEQAKAEAY